MAAGKERQSFNTVTEATDLVRIYPESDEAIESFLSLRQLLDTQPLDDAYRHHASFAVFQPQPPRESSYTPTDGSDDGDSQMRRTSVPGYFKISFLEEPLQGKACWQLGRGSSKIQSRGVDILLPGRMAKSHGVHSIHASLVFTDQGALCLRAYQSGVQVNQKVVSKGQTPVLDASVNYIQLGKLIFRLEFTTKPEHEKAHASAKLQFLRNANPRLGELHPLVSGTPSDTESYIGGRQWKIHGVVGVGGLSRSGRTVIGAASHVASGRLVAVKERVRWNDSTAKAASEEIVRYERIRKHLPEEPEKDLILAIEEVVHGSGQPNWTSGQRDKLYILYTPLAYGDFTVLSAESSANLFNHAERLRFLVHILMGLEFLHKHNIVHRDIKPMNLAIDMTGLTKALIIDLATAEFLDDHGASKRIKPNPGTRGTLGYIAPELETREASDEGEYGVEVDMFSLGVVALEMFKLLDAGMEWSSKPNPFRSPGRLTEIAKYKAAVTHLYRKGNETSLDDLVARMLLWGPDARIPAFGALLHHAIADVSRQERQGLSMRHRLPENFSGEKRPAPQE